MIKEAYDVLNAEGRIRNHKLFEPLLEVADEEPIEQILEKYSIMEGDLFSVRDNLERIITFIGIIASNLSTNGFDMQDKLTTVAEMFETLKIRLHYSIQEDLFDLVLRLNDVGRVRARILHNAGYHTASQVKKERPYA